MKEKMIAALKRSAWTAAETALGMITIGAAFEEVDWIHVISVSGVAAIVSILKSVTFGMPETKDIIETEEEAVEE